MAKIKDSRLRELCLRGVITPLQFWQIRRKNRKNRRSRKVLYQGPKFNLSALPDSECLNDFRFTKSQIRQLVTLFKLPAICRTRRIKFTATEGLCIMLSRLSYPNRLCQLSKKFHRDASALSRIIAFVMKRIYYGFCQRLKTLQQPWMGANTLQTFADVCVAAGSWYPNIVGFIDGTARPICRPSYNQRDLYSGYKKMHVLKYQSVVFPNGLIGRLDGPFIGRRHDAAILGISEIRRDFDASFMLPTGSNYALYGDPGYSNSKFVKVGFKAHRPLSELQKTFNKEMSSLRVSVEYGFGKILEQFAFLDFKKNQQLYLQNLGMQYHVAALLVNCKICMSGSQVADYFNLKPPTVEQYLQ